MNDDPISNKIHALKQQLFQLQQHQSHYFNEIGRLLSEIEALEKEAATKRYQQPKPQPKPEQLIQPPVPPVTDQKQQKPESQQTPVPPQQQPVNPQNTPVPPVPPQQQQNPVPPQQQQQLTPQQQWEQQQKQQWEQQQKQKQQWEQQQRQQWEQQQKQKQLWEEQQRQRRLQNPSPPPGDSWNWEKIIGNKLLPIIGIITLTIGVGIGTYYSIEHNLITPLARIILGYVIGIGLLGFAIRLKKKYNTFSATLLSGAMAIFYFITYIAWSFWDLIPQPAAFGMMVVFTGFTVYSAIRYNMQIIAHIGMVGAYCVPFLLSNDSGRIAVFFSYITLINLGILIISFKRKWKPLYLVSFGLTWLIFASWIWRRYDPELHLQIALGFSAVFFAIFYAVTLAYKLLRQEKFDGVDIAIILVNSGLFYGLGYYALQQHSEGAEFTGLFTAFNGLLHFAAALVVWMKKLSDKNLFYFISGLVLLFITIAFPVQLDGNWVTMAWAGEAAILFWIGRSRGNFVYELFSYPMMAIAFFSMMHDWAMRSFAFGIWNEDTTISVFNNKWFFTSLVTIVAYAVIALVNRSKKYKLPEGITLYTQQTVHVLSWTLFIVLAYFTFRFEIGTYWDQLYKASATTISDGFGMHEYGRTVHDEDLKLFRSIWLINFSLLFFGLLSLLNRQVVKEKVLGIISFCFSIMTLIVFIFLGLYQVSELRESYFFVSTESSVFMHDSGHLLIRYFSIPFALFALFCEFIHIRRDFFPKWLRVAFDFALHYCIIHILSSELLHWMDVTDNDHKSYKLGLSLLWGAYAMFLVVIGIWRKKQYLRVSGIILFFITLMKMVFYDLWQLPTLSKTIIFVCLGILLLVASFLYIRYKHIIFGDDDKEEAKNEQNQA
ncbi:MAG: membrane protein-like protein [Bacteroidetes bacterium]|nr:MAG: membrane protein-like protein [Bacteroidota bacterium]